MPERYIERDPIHDRFERGSRNPERMNVEVEYEPDRCQGVWDSLNDQFPSAQAFLLRLAYTVGDAGACVWFFQENLYLDHRQPAELIKLGLFHELEEGLREEFEVEG